VKFKAVITRSAIQSSDFERELQSLGIDTLILPLIEINTRLEASRKRLLQKQINEDCKNYEGLILTSPNSVINLRELLVTIELICSFKYVILQGEKTKLTWNLCFGETNNILLPNKPNASGIVELLTAINSLDKMWLFFSPLEGLETIPKAIAEAGGVLNKIALYSTDLITLSSQQVLELKELCQNYQLIFTFFSPTAVKSFYRNQLHKQLSNHKDNYYACFGSTSAHELERLIGRVDVVSRESNSKTFAKDIADFLAKC
jgi:uroporphyrinogen-III synthase